MKAVVPMVFAVLYVLRPAFLFVRGNAETSKRSFLGFSRATHAQASTQRST